MGLIAIVGVFLYGFFLGLLVLYWNKALRQTQKTSSNSFSYFSILVPFRNEENNLPHLLRDIKNQNFPAENVEILFIDDHSTDKSFDCIFNDLPFNAKLLKNNHEGKKAAISTGLKHAKHNQIIQLDADVRLVTEWLTSINDQVQEDPCFITGPLAIENPRQFIHHFQALDMMSMMGITQLGIYSKRWFMANAANMSYPTSLITDQNNENEKYASGDDMFLVEKAAKSKLTVKFNLDMRAIALTAPIDTWPELIKQRVRWGSKNHALTIQHTKWLLALLLCFNIYLIGIIPFLSYWYWIWLVKTLIEYFYFKSLAPFFSYRIPVFDFVLSAILYPFFIFYVIIKNIFTKEYFWKNRKWK